MASATCYFVVIAPMYFPVRAAPGEYLAVFFAPENIWVIDSAADRVLRKCEFPESKLWTVLDQLQEADIIRFYAFSEAFLRRMSHGLEQPQRQVALRLVRRS